MFERDYWQEILTTMSKNKLRTFLTALGVFWGIFMLVIMLGCGNGLRTGVLNDFGATATNSFFCWGQKASKPYKGMKPGRWFSFDMDDAIALKEQVNELEDIAPMNQLGGHDATSTVIRGIKKGVFSVYGVYPVYSKINSVVLKSGRFLNENDIKEKRKVTVIGRRISEVLFGKEEDPVGEYVTVNGIYFKVIGVTTPTGSGEQSAEQAEQLHIPFTTFQNVFNNGNRVGWFAITVKKNYTAEYGEEKALALLRERHKIAPNDMMAIGHWNMGVEYGRINGLFTGIEWLVWIVGIGTLVAGAIGVSNIMLIIVKERTREIGVKRALGATPRSVVLQLITESVFLTSIAGYFGLLAGVGLLELISSAIPPGEGGMFQNPQVNVNVIWTALLILVVSGILAGLIPARRAVSISPVDALRSE